ncbi:large ribosomal subunit protein uL23m-like [Liolophura sinensis]|uniref:large ribosomal subunit protein uL23m-like n=1 Tax=Liolophura sinensis TaxID=3198878 RepID=UPI0031580C4D
MSFSRSSQIKHLRSLIPLWQKKIPRYPLYQKGNPQLRIFLPQFWMKMVKPEKDFPPDRLSFIVHPQMTKLDIKNYLEKIYHVPVIYVKTELRPGEDIKHPGRGHVMAREDDYKMAYVFLAPGVEFTFPDIFGGANTKSEKESDDLKKEREKEKAIQAKQWDKLSIPPWFR